MSEYKKIRKIGEGEDAEVFLVKKGDEKFAMKSFEVSKNQIKQIKNKNTKNAIIREIKFAKFANKYPDLFMTFDGYEIKDEKLNLFYEYIPGKSLDQYLDDINVNQLYSLICQTVIADSIMRKHGYMHLDLHEGNIIAVKVKNDTVIKINDYKIKTHGLKFKIIDYTRNLNKNYDLSKKEKKVFEVLSNDIELLYTSILKHFFTIRGGEELTLHDDREAKIDTLKLVKKIEKEPEYDYIIKDMTEKIKKTESRANIVCYLFLILNVKRYMILIGTPGIKNLKEVDVRLRMPIGDMMYFLTNIENHAKLLQYFLIKCNSE
jgi:serine/threonine protein kinase